MTVIVNQLSKRIGGVTVLDEVSLEVPAGTVVGLFGVNGSGKTMLMRAMAGLIRPSKGFVEVDGKRLWSQVPFPPSVGLLIENPAFLESRTGLANLRLLAAIKGGMRFGKAGARGGGADRAASAMRLVGLDPSDKRKYRKYSLGMKQRLGIAAAVMEKPSLLLLDEPANALDVSGVQMLKEVVRSERQRGASIVLACHDVAMLEELSDEVYCIAEGRITGRKTAGEACFHA